MAADQGYEVTEIHIQQKSKFQQCWQSVSKSIYDPETKQFLTRTGSSWGKKNLFNQKYISSHESRAYRGHAI